MVRHVDEQEQAAFFPYNPQVIQATSGRITGVLVQSASNKPSSNGTMVYLNASPTLQCVLDKVEHAGGKVVLPKTSIPDGFIAIIIDSEGNSRVGLHAEE